MSRSLKVPADTLRIRRAGLAIGTAILLVFGAASPGLAQIRIPVPGQEAPAAAPAAPIRPADVPTRFTLGPITVEYPWTRASLTGRDSPVFLTIVNAGEADRLTAVSANVGWGTELVEILVTAGRFRMIPVGVIEVPANASLTLDAPDGNAIGLRNLFADLPEGSVVPLTLTFDKAGDLEVSVVVEGFSAMKHHAAP